MRLVEQPHYTFDDILLEPGFTGFLRSQIITATKLAPSIDLEFPFVSSPMDTVTESGLALALGEAGCFGFIHRNLEIAAQVAEVRKVKEAGYHVGAAIGSTEGFGQRADELVDAGVDALVVDTAHGDRFDALKTIEQLRKRHDHVAIVSGNIAVGAAAKRSIEAGASALRVGMGPGSICTTRLVSGMGVPQITAIMNVAEVASNYNIPVIADGGISYSGDIVKALAAGASTVMFGQLLAGTTEACSKSRHLNRSQVPERFKDIINDEDEIYEFRVYRGMGSRGAMERNIQISSEEEYHGKTLKKGSVLVEEGVEGLVPYVGDAGSLVERLAEGLTSGLFYTGSRSIDELHENAVMQVITDASLRESQPHNIFVQNYVGKAA